MSLDAQTRFSLGLRQQSRQKDNRYSVQHRIGLNPGRDFATIHFRHRDIEENKIRPEVSGCLVSFGRVVFFADKVSARSLQRELNRVGKIAIVIHDQDAGHLLNRSDNCRKEICFDGSLHKFT